MEMKKNIAIINFSFSYISLQASWAERFNLQKNLNLTAVFWKAIKKYMLLLEYNSMAHEDFSKRGKKKCKIHAKNKWKNNLLIVQQQK